MLKLTDGVDDAAVSVASPIQGGQVTDGLLGQLVLQKHDTQLLYNCGAMRVHETSIAVILLPF